MPLYSRSSACLCVVHRSPAPADKIPGLDRQTVTSRPVDNRAKLLPVAAALNEHPGSAPSSTMTSSLSVNKSVSGDARGAADVAGNGHVTNMASNFRFSRRTLRDEDSERTSLSATSVKQATEHHHHRQQQQQQPHQQQQHRVPQNLPSTSSSSTVASTEKTHITDNNLHSTYHQQEQQQGRGLQHLRSQTSNLSLIHI